MPTLVKMGYAFPDGTGIWDKGYAFLIIHTPAMIHRIKRDFKVQEVPRHKIQPEKLPEMVGQGMAAHHS